MSHPKYPSPASRYEPGSETNPISLGPMNKPIIMDNKVSITAYIKP